MIDATPEVVNRLLLEEGLHTGDPGAYTLTDIGRSFGLSIDRDNGYGGYARRDWSWNVWDESVIQRLNATPEKISEMAAKIKSERAAKRMADLADAEKHWASVATEKLGKSKATTSSVGGLSNGDKIVVGVALASAVVISGLLIYGAAKRYQRRSDERGVIGRD